MSQKLAIFLVSAFFILLFGVNYYYQRKGKKYTDEMLKNIPEEWNKQIKANAYIYLISRALWGLFFVIGFIWNVPNILSSGLNWLFVIYFVIGIALIIWGILGFRWEMNKIKTLK